MTKASRMHRGDEFGKPLSGEISASNAKSFFSRRSLGTASTILADGRAEDESGITPPPPPFPMRAVVIGLVVVFVIGVVILVLLSQNPPPPLRP